MSLKESLEFSIAHKKIIAQAPDLDSVELNNMGRRWLELHAKKQAGDKTIDIIRILTPEFDECRKRQAERIEADRMRTYRFLTAKRITAGLCMGQCSPSVLAVVRGALDESGDELKAQAAGSAYQERVRKEHREARINASLNDIARTIPRTLWPESLDTELLPNLDAFNEAIAAAKEGDGLWIYGPSGGAKTRAMASIVTVAAREDKQVSTWTASELKGRLASIATTGDGDRQASITAFIDGLAGVDVLVLDDLFQTFSASFGENLRRLLDHFNGQLIITSNYSPAVAVNREFRDSTTKDSPKEILSAVCRRILERVSVYHFPRGPLARSERS